MNKQVHPHEMESLLSVMMNALEEGYDIDLKDAWEYVQKQESTRFDRYLNSVDVASLPKEFLEKVRQHSVASLPFRSGKNVETVSPKAAKVSDKVDATDFFKNLK